MSCIREWVFPPLQGISGRNKLVIVLAKVLVTKKATFCDRDMGKTSVAVQKDVLEGQKSARYKSLGARGVFKKGAVMSVTP